MTPLQKVGMGIVFLVLKANFGDGWDGLPDPIGWALFLWGVADVRRTLPYGQSLFALSWLALAASLLRYPPAFDRGLDPSALWLLDVVPISCEVLLAFSVAQALGRKGRSFRLIAWVLVISPVLAAGAIADDNAGLGDAGELSRGLAQLALVWVCFSVSRRPEVGGFPKVVRTADRPEPGQSDPPEHDSL